MLASSMKLDEETAVDSVPIFYTEVRLGEHHFTASVDGRNEESSDSNEPFQPSM